MVELAERIDRWERAKRRVINIQLANLGIWKHNLTEPDTSFHKSEMEFQEVIDEVVEIYEIGEYPRVKYCSIGLYYKYVSSPLEEIKKAKVEEILLENPTDQDLQKHREELEKMAHLIIDSLADSLKTL